MELSHEVPPEHSESPFIIRSQLRTLDTPRSKQLESFMSCSYRLSNKKSKHFHHYDTNAELKYMPSLTWFRKVTSSSNFSIDVAICPLQFVRSDAPKGTDTRVSANVSRSLSNLWDRASSFSCDDCWRSLTDNSCCSVNGSSWGVKTWDIQEKEHHALNDVAPLVSRNKPKKHHDFRFHNIL